MDIPLIPSVEEDLTPALEAGAKKAEVCKWAEAEGVQLQPWSELLGVLALVTHQMRHTTVSHWELVLIVYAIVGGRRWRAHDGYLFTYKNGGWRKLAETTPPLVLKEVSAALVNLEGFFCAAVGTRARRPSAVGQRSWGASKNS